MGGYGDTIFAPATGFGAAAIAVFRISGPGAHDALLRLTGRDLPAERVLVRRWLVAPDGTRVDDAMVVRFAAGASFTGEAMAEIHCHGGRAVVLKISDLLTHSCGCRLADPGEFARRAFENQRMDLAAAEGLADLIAAETEMQRQQAMGLLSGELHEAADRWREALIRAIVLLEVTIDWADEEVPEDVVPEVRSVLSGLAAELAAEMAAASRSRSMRLGFEVAIIGPPNAGKSSLLNALAGREAAITSPVPGTTRDVIELRYDLGGLPVIFLDTAGLRDTRDAIEAIGVSHARQRAEGAELRLHVMAVDVTDDGSSDALMRGGDIRVWNKADAGSGVGDVHVSATDGTGVEELLGLISQRLSGRAAGVGLLGHLRHVGCVEAALRAVAEAIAELDDVGFEVTVARLRVAATHLDMLIGRVDVEDVLDAVFSRFCLGK